MHGMVTRYGMSETFDMVALETVTNQYLGGDTSLACAPDTAKLIDEEVIKIVREQHQSPDLKRERRKAA